MTKCNQQPKKFVRYVEEKEMNNDKLHSARNVTAILGTTKQRNRSRALALSRSYLRSHITMYQKQHILC